MNESIYPEWVKQDPEEPKMAYKFSRNIHLLVSFLKQQNIPYNQEDLEDTPFGRALIIRRD